MSPCNGVGALYADADASNTTGAKGRVGIRTLDPKAVLDVNGDSLMRGSLSVDTRLKVGENLTIGYPLNYNPSTDKLAIN